MYLQQPSQIDEEERGRNFKRHGGEEKFESAGQGSWREEPCKTRRETREDER